MPVPISSLIGGGGTITTYTESSVISTSQTVSVPAGTKRIEALVCGGGGRSSGTGSALAFVVLRTTDMVKSL